MRPVMENWRKFENLARKEFERHLGVKLSSGKVSINGKNKSFDLVNLNRRIVGDIKYYRNTKSGKLPSAKRSIANEYVWLLQKLPKKIRKFIVIGEDKKMVNKYVYDFKPWLDDVSIYFYRRGKRPILLKK